MQEDIIKYYIDNKHIEDISGEVSATIIREDGFANSEQILREKTDSQLTAYLCGYDFLAQKRKEDYCRDLPLRIELNNKELFRGTIRQNDLKVQITKGIIKVDNIKDESFSNMIAQFKDFEVPLNSTMTRSGEPINAIPIQRPLMLIVLRSYLVLNVLDVIRYLVDFITDNEVEVISRYLSNANIFISTGYAMRHAKGTAEQMFPTLSLSQVLEEVRKATSLYGVMTEVAGKPTLILEKEEDTFGSDVLINIDTLPLGLDESFDDNQIFNSIQLGGNRKIEQSSERLENFNNIEVFSCGCNGFKDNVLNLRFNFIVDNDTIIRQLDSANYNDDKVWNDDIFMFELDGLGIYNNNQRFKNINILNEWLGSGINCFTKDMLAKYGFLAINRDDFGSWELGFLYFKNPIESILDRQNSLHNWIYAIDGMPMIMTPTQDGTTYFKCQEAGNYTFNSKVSVKGLSAGTYDASTNTILLKLMKASSISNAVAGIILETLTENLIDGYEIVVGEDFQLEIQGSFNLAVNDVVIAMYEITRNPTCYITYQEFSLVRDSLTVLTSENSDHYKPFLAKFKYDLCFEDYEKMRKNKTGIIRINGVDTWIKEVKFNPFGASDFTVKYKDTLC
ncbi:MAG TPA: hypothetical protein PKK18_10915 [Chitinophagales bacterium]|nr:hypothetical protein [Chitinophagales bacterium]